MKERTGSDVAPSYYSLSYSPWSERAAFAIDVCGTEVKHRRYQVTLDEFKMRRKLGKWRGPISMPCLVLADGNYMMESVDIARWANAESPKDIDLFPEEHLDKINELLERSEAVMRAGRVVNIDRLAKNDEALRTYLPKFARKSGLGVAFARSMSKRVLRKYGSAGEDLSTSLATFRKGMAALEQERDGRDTLFETLTFADIAVAQCVSFIKPLSDSYLRMSKIVREEVWDSSELGVGFDDAVAWRDALYDKYRTPRKER